MSNTSLKKVREVRERYRGGKRKGYHIRNQGEGYCAITIAPEIGRLVPPGTRFLAEWHEDGILLRRMESPESPPPRPAWLLNGDEQ